MNNKIISIIFLLIILVSLVLVYSFYNKSTGDEKHYDTTIETIDEKNVSEEIDDTFIEEDGEIEIGEMV